MKNLEGHWELITLFPSSILIWSCPAFLQIQISDSWSPAQLLGYTACLLALAQGNCPTASLLMINHCVLATLDLSLLLWVITVSLGLSSLRQLVYTQSGPQNRLFNI